MVVRTVASLLVLTVALLVGCGPEGPREQGGPKADPVELLGVLPTPAELSDTRAAYTAGNREMVDTILDGLDAEAAERVDQAGLERVGIRRWRGADGGDMAAVVTVWPTRAVAANFALQVAQHHLERGGSAWTPREVPGSQGVRERPDEGRRVLTRGVGPNALIVSADGSIPDATVETAMERLVVVQEARND